MTAFARRTWKVKICTMARALKAATTSKLRFVSRPESLVTSGFQACSSSLSSASDFKLRHYPSPGLWVCRKTRHQRTELRELAISIHRADRYSFSSILRREWNLRGPAEPRMSLPGRPKGEFRSAKHGECLMSASRPPRGAKIPRCAAQSTKCQTPDRALAPDAGGRHEQTLA